MVQGFPEESADSVLSGLFSALEGFKTVKIARLGLAFVIFDTEINSTDALEKLQGHEFSEEQYLQINYAKT